MRSCVSALVLCMVTLGSVDAQHWESEQIDSVGSCNRLRGGASADGRVHACYSGGSGVFYYAWTDTVWQHEQFTGEAVSSWDLAVSKRGHVGLLACRGATTDSFKLFERTDTGWQSSRLPLETGERASRAYHLAYDTLGNLAIAYYLQMYAGYWQRIRYSSRTDTTWSHANLNEAGLPNDWLYGPADLQVSWTNNHAAVIHGDGTNRHACDERILAAVRDGAGHWVNTAVATRYYGTTVVPWSAAPRAGGGAASCYSIWAGDDSTFCGEHLLSASAGRPTRVLVQVDSLDQEHVVFDIRSRFVHAWRCGAAWSQETIPAAPDGRLQDFVLDCDDVPNVFYLTAEGRPAVARTVRSDHDIGAAVLVSPQDTVGISDSLEPGILVCNFGRSSESFDVVMSIGAAYADTVSVSDLAPGDSQLAVFAPWTPDDTGRVDLCCNTLLRGDEWPANDTVRGSVVVVTTAVGERCGVRKLDIPPATVLRGRLLVTSRRASLISPTGRKVLDLPSGTNDLKHLAPGVYFVRAAVSSPGQRQSDIHKVVVAH